MDNNFNNQQYGQQFNTQQFNTPQGNINTPGYILWLILGIVQICSMCCCNCVGFIFGVITVIFAVQANGAFKQSNFAVYQSKIRTAKIINIIGWVFMFGSAIISLVSGLFSQVSDYITSMM